MWRLIFLAGALVAAGLSAAVVQDDWLRMVNPVLSSAERARYRSLAEEARVSFREHFWDDKAVSAAEFATRAEHVDAMFGSGKRGSGENTDQGRVYLSLGAPNRVTNLSSSRSFVPLEIWYYANAPQVGAGSELRLLFYRKNSTGLPKLYSPTLDTIRDLLNPQPGTRGLFGPNETADINAMREKLSARPVENEVLEAAAGVSPGVRGQENDSILLQSMSPEKALRSGAARTQVKSRLLEGLRNLDVIQSASAFGGTQVDLQWKGKAAKLIRVEVTDRNGAIYRNDLALNFDAGHAVEYRHRLDLLPGYYSLLITADGQAAAYPLQVGDAQAVGALVRGKVADASTSRTPLTFGQVHLEPAADGADVMVTAPAGSSVSWVIREGMKTIWKQAAVSDGVATIRLPAVPANSGRRVLEASVNGESRSLDLSPEISKEDSSERVISYNANLRDAARWNFLGRQWLRKQKMAEARQAFEASLSAQPSNAEALTGLARVDAAGGRIDEARSTVRQILAQEPRNFDALTAMAYLEAQLQDYPMAASYFRQALSVQDSPVLRRELESLPR